MSREERYSLLLMRDDGKVYRVRLKRRLLIALLCCMFCLPALGGLGVWFGWSALQKDSLTSRESVNTVQELSEARMELQRLKNLETLLQRDDPELLHSLLATAPEPAAPPVTENPKSAAPRSAKSTKPQSDTNTNSTTVSVTDVPAIPTNSTNATASIFTMIGAGQGLPASGIIATDNATKTNRTEKAPALAANATSAVSTPTNATIPVTIDPPAGSPAQEIDDGQVRLDNVRIRVNKGNLRVGFGLYNAAQKEQLNGKVALTLKKADGSELPLVVTNDSTIFRIVRFKKVLCTARLTSKDLKDAGILLQVQVDDAIAYQKLYPLDAE